MNIKTLSGFQFCLIYLLVSVGAYGQTSNKKGNDADFSKVPGTVVNHAPVSSGVHLGSPSIVTLPNGDYLVSHSFSSFRGDKGKIHRTAIFKSADDGKTWEKLTEMDNQRWSTLFYHRDALYLIGTHRAFGNAVIRKSVDGGKTWTTPIDEHSGLLAEGRYHCAPVPVVIHNGRIWRAMEDAPRDREFRAFMMSAPVDADLMKAESWTFSTKLPYDESWYGGKMRSWLEGNAVVTPDKKIVNVLRVKFSDGTYGKAAIMNISADGKKADFDPEQGFITMPGATGKKFTIRYDPKTGKYWSLVNWIQPKDTQYLDELGAGKIRNTLALTSSKDLRNWIVERIILHHPDVKNHAFQYVDWLFEGEDIIAVSRTAYDDGLGGAANYHDANFITFHRIRDFRTNFNFDPSWD